MAAVTATVAAEPVPGAVAVRPENRVNGFDVFSLPRVGLDVPFSPDCVRDFPLDLRRIASAKPYAYVGGDPLNATDPSGLDQDLPGGFCIHVPFGDSHCGPPPLCTTIGNSNCKSAMAANGHCIVGTSNCQGNLVSNIHTVEDSPIGPVVRADPFMASGFDLVKARSGEEVGARQGAFDVIGMIFVFTPAKWGPGAGLARVLGPGMDDWVWAVNAWNNRRWISRGISICKNEITGGR